jgi:hypothetical protein
MSNHRRPKKKKKKQNRMDVLDSIHRVTLFELNHDYKVIL